MLLRRLPFEDPASLFTLYETRREHNAVRTLSYPEFQSLQLDLAQRAQLAAFVRVWAALGDTDQPAQVVGELVTPDYFAILAVEPALGRFFDRTASASDVAVLSHGLWQRRFGGAEHIVGQQIRLNRSAVTVIGVAPAGFRGPAWRPEFWLPIEAHAAIFGDDVELSAEPATHWLQTIGRLTSAAGRGVGAGQILDRVDHSGEPERSGVWELEMLPARQLRFFPTYRFAVARVVGGFEILALLVLVTAAANLSTMMIAQGQSRTAEMAVRRALGARRHQLARRLAAEVGVVGVAGTLLGLLLMKVGSPLAATLSLPVPVRLELAFDAGAAAWAAAAGLAGCVLLGLLVGAVELREGSFRQLRGGDMRESRVTAALVVAQVAASTILLVAMSLLVRSAWNTASIDPGFRTSGIATASVTLDDSVYDEGTGGALYVALQRELAGHPLISESAITSVLPLQFIRSNVEVTSSRRAAPEIAARLASVSAGYFELLRIPILAGRSIAETDVVDSAQVAVVNGTLARILGGDVVGTRIQLGLESQPRLVVGVVADFKYNVLTETDIPFVHVPLQQMYWPQVSIMLDGRDPQLLTMVAALRDVLDRRDPLIPIDEPRLLSTLHDDAAAESRASAAIASTFGAAGLLLAITGQYAMLAHSLARRRREMAIRSALGATPRVLRREALMVPARSVLAGIALGLLGANLTAGALSASLVGVPSRDLPSLVATAMVVIAAAVSVAWLPASRSARQHPADVLRAE